MIKESQDSALTNINGGKNSSNLTLHVCPICGLTYLIPEDQTQIHCKCGTILDVSPECLLQELIYFRDDDIKIEGVYEIPEKAKFHLDYCNHN